MTAKLNWSHPEHTIEFTTDEIIELVTLAGFTIKKCAGLWQIEDKVSGTILPFEEQTHSGKHSITSRIEYAESHPDQAFIWWVEARKTERKPDVERLTQRVADIFKEAWPERCQRMQTVIGQQEDNWYVSHGKEGVLLYGPYMPLKAGTHSATFKLRIQEKDCSSNHCLARCEILTANADDPLVETSIINPTCDDEGNVYVTLSFTLPDTTFGIQFRVVTTSNTTIAANRIVKLTASKE
jgi:hypothetical protein